MIYAEIREGAEFERGMIGNLWVFAQSEGGQLAPGPSAPPSGWYFSSSSSLPAKNVSLGITSAWLAGLIPLPPSHNLYSFWQLTASFCPQRFHLCLLDSCFSRGWRSRFAFLDLKSLHVSVTETMCLSSLFDNLGKRKNWSQHKVFIYIFIYVKNSSL